MAKVMISMPGVLLRQVDRIAREVGRNRSELIRESLRSQYLGGGSEAARDLKRRRAYESIMANRFRWEGKLSSTDFIRKMRDERYSR